MFICIRWNGLIQKPLVTLKFNRFGKCFSAAAAAAVWTIQMTNHPILSIGMHMERKLKRKNGIVSWQHNTLHDYNDI